MESGIERQMQEVTPRSSHKLLNREQRVSDLVSWLLASWPTAFSLGAF